MELTCDRAAGHNSRSLGRFVSSTIIGEAVDTCIFFPIGFLGVIPTFDLAKTMVTVYAAKILYEVAALPLSTRADTHRARDLRRHRIRSSTVVLRALYNAIEFGRIAATNLILKPVVRSDCAEHSLHTGAQEGDFSR